MSREDAGSRNYGLSPLAGVSAGTAAVLFAFGVLALAWHRVAAQVATGITVLVYVFIAAVGVVTGAGAWLAVLWVAHRHRHPELLAPRRAVRAQVTDAEPPPGLLAPPAAPSAIEPPRVYFTDDQFAAIMRQHAQPPPGAPAERRRP